MFSQKSCERPFEAAGSRLAGSGVMAAFQGKWAMFEAAGAGWESEASRHSPSDMGGREAADEGPPAEPGGEAELRQQHRLVVDCWGPAFMKGTAPIRPVLAACLCFLPAGQQGRHQ